MPLFLLLLFLFLWGRLEPGCPIVSGRIFSGNEQGIRVFLLVVLRSERYRSQKFGIQADGEI